MTLINDWLPLFLNIMISAPQYLKNQIVGSPPKWTEQNIIRLANLQCDFFSHSKNFHAILSKKKIENIAESRQKMIPESLLTLNAPIATKVVCFSSLLKCLRSLFGKQCGPRLDCSYRSSLIWVHTDCDCFYT